jgi:hypothetical protein
LTQEEKQPGFHRSGHAQPDEKSYESNADFNIINRQLYLLQQKQDAIQLIMPIFTYVS